MLSSQQTRQVQNVMVLITLLLALYYAAVYRPLVRHAGSFDEPLDKIWRDLATTKAIAGNAGGLDNESLDRRLSNARASLLNLKSARERIATIIALDPATRARMQEPFQLIDFQLEEQFRIEELGRLAHEHKVIIAPQVFAGFPEYTAGNSQPPLLWPQLLFLEQLLDTAVRCHVAAIHKVELPPIAWHADPDSSRPDLIEIPLRAELTGTMEAVSKLLLSLPTRPDAAKALNLPELSPSKPALFIHRLILRKNSPEAPDEVHLELRACGFVHAE